MSIMDLTSNAFNFSEFIKSGVDTRTGSFSLEFSLGILLSNNLSGPNFEQRISYNPFGNKDYGYGRGWQLQLTQFDKSNYNLTLKSGQVFRIDWDNALQEYLVPYRKLQDTKIYYLNNISKSGETSRAGLKIAYKNGELEFIDWDRGTLERRVSPHGQEIHFEYADHSGTYRLIKVSDSVGNELNTEYWGSNQVTKVSVITKNGKPRHICLYKMGSELDRVTLPNTEKLFTSIKYESLYNVGARVISTVTHATGQVDKIWYEEMGHQCPSGSPLSHYPYVIRFQSLYEKDQAPKTIEYDYSTYNFLGYNSGVSWVKDEDTLFKVLPDYTFSSNEIINGNVRISRSYNKYHLIDKEEYFSNDFLYQSVEYLYFANLNWNINDQPKNYSLVREERVTFYTGSGARTEINTYDYDIYGNLISNVCEDGSTTCYEYYPLEGAENQCPEAPNRIVRYLKSERLYLPSQGIDSIPYREKYVEYKAIPMLNYGDYFVVPVKQINHNNEVTLTYYEDINDNNTFGRIKSKATTINGYTSRIDHAYHFDMIYLSVTTTMHSHDGYSVLKREHISYATGNLFYTQDEQDIGVKILYDDFDRVVSESWVHHETVKISRNYVYTTGDGKNQLAMNESTGREKIFKFSNANNLISIYQQDNDLILFKCHEFIYDAYGQITRQFSFDRINSVIVPMHEDREYSHWGQVSKITYPDGTKEIFQQDVVTMQTSHYFEGLTRAVTQNNIAGKELSITTYDSNGVMMTKITNDYNDAYQLIRTLDNNNLETLYRYDSSDRVIEYSFFDEGKKVSIETNYAPFSNELLATEISVNKAIMGKRVYDGLGRLTTESKFNDTSIDYEYTDSSAKATKIKTESDHIIEMRYEPFWGEKSVVILDGDEQSASRYQYDSKGLLISESNSDCEITYEYNNLDQLVDESVDITGSKTPLSASYSYSPMGVLLQQTDFMGMSKEVSYDSLSRIKHFEFLTKNCNGNVSIDINYDLYSRPAEFIYNNGKDIFKNSICYNSFGVESRKTTHKNNATIAEVDLSLTYLNNLKINNRNISFSGVNVTVEDMEYDKIGRLVNYHTVGGLIPRDHIDNFTSQTFNFDIYNNIDSKATQYSSVIEKVHTDYQYDDLNKTQRSGVSNPSANIELKHDRAGNLLNDEFGNQYEYDAFNKLKCIKDSSGNIINRYQYDPRGFLISQCPFNGQKIYLYYQFNSLANECSSTNSTSYISVDSKIIGRVIDEVNHQYMATDNKGSVLSTWSRSQGQWKQSINTYTPYGSNYKVEVSS